MVKKILGAIQRCQELLEETRATREEMSRLANRVGKPHRVSAFFDSSLIHHASLSKGAFGEETVTVNPREGKDVAEVKLRHVFVDSVRINVPWTKREAPAVEIKTVSRSFSTFRQKLAELIEELKSNRLIVTNAEQALASPPGEQIKLLIKRKSRTKLLASITHSPSGGVKVTAHGSIAPQLVQILFASPKRFLTT